jgi:hypothetical protein
MTKDTGRPYVAAARHGRVALVVLAVALAWTQPATAVGPHKAQAKGATHAKHASRKAAKPARSQAAAPLVERLSLSDEFDRAELVEQMLAECRGIPYNAYELAQTSGEALTLPAPIQLMTVRVRHPYCAELLRTYAPKSRV